MSSYVLQFSGSGEVCEGHFKQDSEAVAFAESVLEARGYEPSELVRGDWDADGQNDDGEQCYRLLFWENEDDAEDDAGQLAIAQLCKVVER